MQDKSTVERAFELARHGPCRTIGELRVALKSEQCTNVEGHLAGKSIIGQLQAIMKAKVAD